MEKNVARLDGWLNGIATFSGNIRDYSAFSYLIELDVNSCSIELALRNFFSTQANLEILDIESLKHGLQDLELELETYLVRDTDHVSMDNLLDIKKYLSFRTMDLIATILNGKRDIEVLKLNGNFDSSKSICVFFCIRIKSIVLVLQFNNDIMFNKQLTAM